MTLPILHQSGKYWYTILPWASYRLEVAFPYHQVGERASLQFHSIIFHIKSIIATFNYLRNRGHWLERGLFPHPFSGVWGFLCGPASLIFHSLYGRGNFSSYYRDIDRTAARSIVRLLIKEMAFHLATRYSLEPLGFEGNLLCHSRCVFSPFRISANCGSDCGIKGHSLRWWSPHTLWGWGGPYVPKTFLLFSS